VAQSKVLRLTKIERRSMTKLPEPAAHLADSLPLYTKAQMLQFRRDALDDAASLNWTEIMREGALVTWHDAETLGDRVIAKLDAMKDET
jgi:hypothetical protein